MSRLLTQSEERRQFARIVRGLLRQERQDLAAVERKHPPVTRQIGCDICGLPCVPGLSVCRDCLDAAEKALTP